MENQKITKKYRILLMGEYRNLFIRGAFPSLKKRKNKEYKKIIHYNNNIIELSIIDIDEPSLIENQINLNNNIRLDGIIALFVIDATDDNTIIEINSIIEDIKSKYSNKDIFINEYILLGIIRKTFHVEQNILDSKEDCMPLLVFHKLAEKQKCFCYDMDESEEEIDYNIFFVNYAMFFWLEFDKIYSNEELKEMIEKNSGNENKDIKIKYYTEKDLKNIEEKRKKTQMKELTLINKEKDKKELSKKKLIKIKEKEESKKQNIILDSLKKRYSNRKTNNIDETKDKLKKSNIWNIVEENKKDKLIELYNKENPSILRCPYCYEIPEIQIINDKYIKINCKNYKDENHIGKENIINITYYKKIIFEQNEDKIKQINYNKNKCIYCNKNQDDIIKDFTNFINLEQKESENLSYEDLKNNFFYYYNENKIFFCNICRNFVCQKCKHFHIFFCKQKQNIKDDIINSYENYDEIKNLIDERIIDYENEVNLNKQFMPLYMFDTFCIKHKKLCNYFCDICKVNLCSDCIEHNAHNILDWADSENVLIIKQENLLREKIMVNHLAEKIAELIHELKKYFQKLLEKQLELLDFKEKIILNGTYINNNYNIYKNMKNIEFNMKYFDEEKYQNENNIIKKLSFLLDYFNEPYSIITNKLFNEKTKEKLYKNTSLLNDIFQNKPSISNSNKSSYHITSLINFKEQKIEYKNYITHKSNNTYNNIFAFTTDNGDANFYKIEKNGKFTKILSIFLFSKNKGIFDMKKIENNKLLFGGYEQLKIVDIQISNRRYNIINVINKPKSYFIKNCALNKDIILSYFSNKEINLITLNNNKKEIESQSWSLLNNNCAINENIDCIINNSYELISLIKLDKKEIKNKFIISISNNETTDNNKDIILFYNIDKNKKNLFLEKYIFLPKINKSENNIFELNNSNSIICLLGNPINSAAIINIKNDYSLENVIKLNNYDIGIKTMNEYYNFTFFNKYSSIYFMDNYFLSFNKNMDLIQWKFDYENNKFITIDNLSFNFIKKNNRFGGNKSTEFKNLLFYQVNNIFIGLTNDDLIYSIILEE